MVRLQEGWRFRSTQATLICFTVFIASACCRPGGIEEWKNLQANSTTAKVSFPAIYSPIGTAYYNIQWSHIIVRIPVASILFEAENLLATLNIEFWDSVFQGGRLSPLLSGQMERLSTIVQAVKEESLALQSRVKRGFDINLDVPEAIKSMFNGISNLINAPTLRELEEKLENVVKVIHSSTKFQKMLVGQMEDMGAVIDQLAKQDRVLEAFIVDQTTAFEAWSKMEETKDILYALASVAHEVANHRLPSDLIMPAEAESILHDAQRFAETKGLEVPLNSLFEIYQLPVSYMADSDEWLVVLHLPMINPKSKLNAFEFVPFPALMDGRAITVDHAQGMVALSEGLESDVVSIFVEDFRQSCTRFNQTILCDNTPVHRTLATNCPAQIIRNSSTSCKFKEVEVVPPPRWWGGHLLAFFFRETEVAISCPNKPQTIEKNWGRVNLTLGEGCSASTTEWTFTAPMNPAILSVQIQHTPIVMANVTKGIETRLMTEERVVLTKLDQIDEHMEILENELEDLENDKEIIEYASLSINSACTLVILIIIGTLLWRACKIPMP